MAAADESENTVRIIDRKAPPPFHELYGRATSLLPSGAEALLDWLP